MKALFLDIDGVVCLHEKGVVNWGENADDDVFDADCCRRLRNILRRTGCKLVLSSAWRLNRKDIRRMLEQLAPFSVTAADFIGKTPEGRSRGEEIMAFLRRHPEITSYIALDDEPVGPPFPADRLVTTALSRGITDEIAAACVRLLS